MTRKKIFTLGRKKLYALFEKDDLIKYVVTIGDIKKDNSIFESTSVMKCLEYLGIIK